MNTHIKDEAWAGIDQAGITLCYALFAFDEGLISEGVMNCYRDTFAEEIYQLFGARIEMLIEQNKKLKDELAWDNRRAQYSLNYGNDGGL